MGLRPTRETFARFYSLRINSVQGKNIPKPKPHVQCGSCIIGFRQGGPFFKFAGLDSCRAWERTFFYVKNTGRVDLINLPTFDPAVPTRANWSYNPKGTHNETNRIIRFMKKLMKDIAFCPDDIVRTFISRRVLPLQRRAHKMSEMYGPGDPTKITGLPLSKEDVVLKARHICQTSMTPDWEWGLLPLSTLNPPSEEAKLRFPRIDADRRGICRFRALDKVDPDPYIHWADLKMGRIPISRLEAPSASTDPQVHEHAVPLQAEVGHEFLEKLTSQDKKRKDRPDADPSAAPPTKRPKKPTKRHYVRREMPTSDGSPRGGDLVSPPVNEDIGASNTGAEPEDAGPVGTLVPTAPKKKKKISASSSSRSLPEASAPAKTITAPGAPKATSMPPPAGSVGGSGTAKPPTPPPSQEPIVAKNKPAPPPEGAKLRMLEPFKGKATASGPQPLVLHTGPAAVVAGEKATGLLGRITSSNARAASWVTCLITLVESGRQHGDAGNSSSRSFWGAPDGGAHSHRQVIPEASIEALKTQLSDLHAEKEQLLQKHQEALDAQKEISRQLKDQAMQAGLRHDEEMRDAKAAAEAKLAEVLEESSNANAVLLAELEEERKARKAVEHRMELMTTDHREYDRLVMQIDALALKHFPDSQTYAVKKVMEDRVAREFPNMDAHWDGYDYLVALSARVQHMRSVDRSLADLPDAAIQICKVLWPGEPIPANVTLTADRLKGAGRRIREWKCSAARAGALRIACSWYEDLDLDSFHSLRRDAPTDTDPVLTAKRKDRAYQIAESAPIRTFIPPPPESKIGSPTKKRRKKMRMPKTRPQAPRRCAPPEAPVA
ncbi:hypothetical protein QYE76_036992 [Lolium multiflorum]|uniref:Uncharacterized protein n=1 Tax=Lolium multiflorum TaxID=4521 RepID=A0AAD8R5G6_LOLMU|nr:hypothetical protein QYE76_036992 [Lolium multiflorum]